jgi:hypothetical protein
MSAKLIVPEGRGALIADILAILPQARHGGAMAPICRDREPSSFLSALACLRIVSSKETSRLIIPA